MLVVIVILSYNGVLVLLIVVSLLTCDCYVEILLLFYSFVVCDYRR